MTGLLVYASDGGEAWVALEYDTRLGSGTYEEAVLLCEVTANVGRWGCWTEWTGGDPVSTMDQLGPVARPDARSGTGYRVVRVGHGPGTVARDDFAHRPLVINQNRCGGCDVCGDEEEQEICDRCTGHSRRNIRFPCSTAVVLGLSAARPA